MLCRIEVGDLGLFGVGVIGLTLCLVVGDIISNRPTLKKVIPYDND